MPLVQHLLAAAALLLAMCGQVLAQPSAPPADPDDDSSKVIGLYGSTYQTIDGIDYNPNWNQNTQVDTSSGYIKYSNLNWQGTQFSSIDASSYTGVHLDYYPMDDVGSLEFTLISPGAEKLKTLSSTAKNQWNSIDIPLTDFAGVVDTANIFQWKFAGSGTVYLDNIYIYQRCTDSDGDGVCDADDAFPNDAAESVDTDGDGTGDNADTDDDGDGVLDAVDELPLDGLKSVATTDFLTQNNVNIYTGWGQSGDIAKDGTTHALTLTDFNYRGIENTYYATPTPSNKYFHLKIQYSPDSSYTDIDAARFLKVDLIINGGGAAQGPTICLSNDGQSHEYYFPLSLYTQIIDANGVFDIYQIRFSFQDDSGAQVEDFDGDVIVSKMSIVAAHDVSGFAASGQKAAESMLNAPDFASSPTSAETEFNVACHVAGGGSPNFSGTFDGTTASTDSTDSTLAHTGSDGSTTELVNTFSFPSGSKSYAGFSNDNADLYPLQFSSGNGMITFDAKAPSGDVKVKFKFENEPWPDNTASFETDEVTVSGSALTRYAVAFSGINNIDYTSLLMYLTTQDVEVKITNIAVCQDTSAANQCDSSNFVLPVQPTKYDVTFKVDMTGVQLGGDVPTLQGTFNGWCGDCGNAMTQVGSTDVWEITVSLVNWGHEYKYAIGNWQDQESVPSRCDDTLGSGPYNRYVNVNGAAVDIPVRPYEGCAGDTADTGDSSVVAHDYDGHTVTICKGAYNSGHSINFYVSDLALTDSLSVLAVQEDGSSLGYGNLPPKEDLCNTGFVGTFDDANGFALSSSAIDVQLTIVGEDSNSQHTVSITPDQLPQCAITFPCAYSGDADADFPPTTYSNTDIGNGIALTVCKTSDTLEYRFDDSAASNKLDLAFAGQKEPGYTSQVIYETEQEVELKGDAPWTVKVTFGSSSDPVPSTLTSSQILWSTEGVTGNGMIQAKLRQPIQVPDCVVRIGCLNNDYVEYDFPADIPCSHLRNPDSANVEVWKFDSDFQLVAQPCPDAAGGQCNSEKQAYDLSASDITYASPKSTLTITTRKDSTGTINTHDDAGWVSSRFNTKGTSKTIRVGDRLCADAKLPSSLGYWPALWFMGEGDEMTRVGADPWTWPQIGEIDMMEITTSNGPAYDHSHFHYRTKGGKADFAIGGPNPPDEYTRWCIALYKENVVVTRQAIDGIGGSTSGALTVRSTSWPWNPDMQYKKMDWFFIVNVAIGGTLGGDISNLEPFTAKIGNVKKYTSAKSHARLQDECVVKGRCAEFSYTSSDKMSTWLMEASSNLDNTPFMIPYGPWASISAEDATTKKRSLIFSPHSDPDNSDGGASGFVNAADNIYPLRFPNGGTIIFTYDLEEPDFQMDVAEICKMQIVLAHHPDNAYGNGVNDKAPAITRTGVLSFGYSTFTLPAAITYYNSLTFNFVDTAAAALSDMQQCELKNLKVRINVNPPNDGALMSDSDWPDTGGDTGADTGGDLSSVGSQELLEELNTRRSACQS